MVILEKDIDTWIESFPELKDITALKPISWTNSKINNKEHIISKEISLDHILDASKRLERFAPYIKRVFPEAEKSNGIIESELRRVPHMKNYLAEKHGFTSLGELYLKLDSHLPISGSIKARGGIYEVLYLAEKIAIQSGVLKITDDYSTLDSDKFKEIFSKYHITVGSTGNLGLSIGIMSAQLGFDVTVHMSADAKQWKKDMLRTKGAKVVEYEDDYSKAVEEGRKQCEGNPNAHFIDDENSVTLFLGYAVAALRLQQQFEALNIKVNQDHPLIVYLPCGVGGAPGGVTFGLRTIFGNNVHCIFVEPTHSPAMMLGLLTGEHHKVSAQQFGIDNITAADGLAVGRPSGFVGRTLEYDIAGAITVEDETLYKDLYALYEEEGITLEPSALAGFEGYVQFCSNPVWKNYAEKHGLTHALPNSTHIAWATGGGMVPADIMQDFIATGKALTNK